MWTTDLAQKGQIEALLRSADRYEATEPYQEPLAVNIEIGVTATDSLVALREAGFTFRWHATQYPLNRGDALFGVDVEDTAHR